MMPLTGLSPRVPVLPITAALLLLNAVLSFENWWPTPAIKPDSRLAPEFVGLWLLLLLLVRIRGAVSMRWVSVLSVAYLLLVIGRYGDVTAPALFGRPINLYWDGHQIPIVLSVLARKVSWWVPPVIALVLAVALMALYRSIRWAIRWTAHETVPRALRSPTALAVSAMAALLVGLNLAGVRATWPYVAKPVIPTYARQVNLLAQAYLPGALPAVLPASPSFDGGVDLLAGADVQVFFLESYGATAFDDSGLKQALSTSRGRFAKAADAAGFTMLSARVRSPTFGGGSELAHLGFLSGLDLSDPFRHDLLLTTSRPTMVSFFRRNGYTTYGLYSSLSWDWPEKSFYAFDVFLDGRDLDYRGPHFGPWWIPDQFAIARFEQLHAARADGRPRFVFFPTIMSHIPFEPVPPYQPDWNRLLTVEAYDSAEARAALGYRPDWLNLRPGFVRAIDYTYDWLAGYVARPRPRPLFLVLLGDHQPAASVSGLGASWDVPVHILTSSTVLADRLQALGFERGIEPTRPVLADMHEFARRLVSAFDSSNCIQVAGACERKP